MDLKSCNKILTDIYIVSNTPAYLFETMRNSPIVCDYLAKQETEVLIKEFNIRIATSISDISEVAEIYAIMIALTFKKGEEVKRFFEYIINKINFEWFPKIAMFYLENKMWSSSEIIDILPSFNSDGSNLVQITI